MRTVNVCLVVGTMFLGLLPERAAGAPIMHFDATALALGNGATVTSWAGQTSTGNPVFRTVQTPTGGPAVDFGSGASFGTKTLSPSASGDFFLAAVLKPTAANAYHNVIEAQPAGAYPLLWIDTGNRYELNKGGGTKVPIGDGAVQGWDIVIADSKNNLLYVNSTTDNGTGGSAYSFNSSLTFSFFHRNNGQRFQGLVAELRIYNEAIDVATVYEELYQKWTWLPWSTVDSSGSYTWNDAPWNTGAPPRIDQTGLLRGGGTVTISGQSTATTPGGLLIGHGGSFGVEMTGGTLTVGNTLRDSQGVFGLTVGESVGHGFFTQAGGVVTSPIVNLARLSNSLSGTYSLNGGTLETGLIRRGSGSGTATLNLGGGTLRATQSSGGWIAPGIVVNVQAGGAMIDTQNCDVTILSPILDGGGGGGLTMYGSTAPTTGVLRLGAAGTYTGPTNVDAGYLVTNVNDALPATTVLNLNGVGGAVSRLDLGNTTQKIAGLTSTDGATGTIDIYSGGGSAGVLEVDVADGNTFTYYGAVGNSLDGGNRAFKFAKSGLGTQVLRGQLLHTGGTQVAGGTLQIGDNDAWNYVGADDHQYTVDEGATLVFHRNYTPTDFKTQSIDGEGDVVFRGQQIGYFRFQGYTGTLSYTGKTIVDLDDSPGNWWYQGTLWLETNNVLPRDTVVDLQGGKIYTRQQHTTGLIIAGLEGNAGTFITTDQGALQKWNINVAMDKTYTYAGRIGSDDGGNRDNVTITKSGEGTQVLTGANTYTGPTTIAGGTLAIGGSGSLGNTDVTVRDGGTLAGTGTIGGPVSLQSGGSLAPGMSVGTLNLNGNLTFAAGSFFDVDIEEVEEGVSIADLVDMSGGTNTLTLSAEAFIRVHLLDGFSPDVRTSYTILEGENNRVGEFNTGVLVWDGFDDYLPKFDGWKWFDVSYGNSVLLTVVPEPGTWLLLLSAVVCGLAVRRR